MAKSNKKKTSLRKQIRLEKLALKQAKKQNKNHIPENEKPIICPSDRAGAKLHVRIIGYACRMLVIFMAVFGLTFFMCDALRLEAQELSVPTWLLAVACFGFVALFSAMSASKYGLLGGGVLLFGGAVWLVIASGNIADYAVKLVMTVKNVVLTRLFKIGYYGVQSNITEISYSGSFDAEYFIRAAFVLVAGLLALAFVLSCLKQVKVIVPTVISVAIIGLVFTYNISRSNWGVVLIIASYLALIVMAVYDKMFVGEQDKSRVDQTTVLFADDDRPKMPEGVITPEEARRIRKQKKQEFKQVKKQNRKQKKELTVEQELADYFGSSVKATKIKTKKAEGADPEALKRQKTEQRELNAQVRKVQRYDRAVEGAKRAHGGIAAMGAFVLAMIMLIMPALTVTGHFSTIELIDEKMEEYREFVTAWLMGDDPILDDLGYKNDKSNFMPHSTVASPQYYTGEKVMTVEASNNYNVYLRGWIGVDYEDGAWHPADEETFEEYRGLYGTTIDPNELLFNYFYSIMDPSVVESREFYKNHNSKVRYGLIAMQVNMDRVETEDSLVYMPAFYRVDDDMRAVRGESHGLFEYGTGDPLEDVTFVNYFDGLYTGRKFMAELAYASVAYVTTMKVNDWYTNVAPLISEFNQGYNDAYKAIEKYAERLAKKRSASLDDIVKDIFSEQPADLLSVITDEAGKKILLVQYYKGQVQYTYNMETGELENAQVVQLTEFPGVDAETGEPITYTLAFAPPELPLSIRFREVMTTAERRELAYAYYWQYLYENFVYGTYARDDDSKIIKDKLAEIINQSSYETERTFNEETGEYEYNQVFIEDRYALATERHSSATETYEQRHELVMAIVDYLQKNYTYTLKPTATADATLDGVENFLSVTKEGYCVQYASALALLLREAGIPARYVEGYVACDFVRNYSKEAASRYITTVRDYNEHAWVEVWYDGVGWVQYEAVPVYYDDMYVKATQSSSGSVRPWYDPEDEMTPEEELIESISSSIDFAATMIESIRMDIRFMVGGSKIRSMLDSLEERNEYYRSYLQSQAEYYEANKDAQGYDSTGFIAALEMIQQSIETEINEPLMLQLTLANALASFNTVLRVILVAALIVAAIIVAIIFAHRKAREVEEQRMRRIKVMADGGVDPDALRGEATALSRWLSGLLAAYGSGPRKGEFREEYAARLQKEYLDTFGQLKRVDPADPESATELVSDTDFSLIFEALAAEEFGNGMTAQQLSMVAAFYVRLRGAAKRKLSPDKRIFYHYIKRMI